MPMGTTFIADINNTATTTFSNVSLPNPNTQYNYAIIAYNWDGVNPETYNYYTGETIQVTNARTFCESVSLPYSENFETAIIPGMPTCTSIENAGSGNNWVTVNSPGNGFTSTSLEYYYSETSAANAWFFTHGLSLAEGISYRLTFDYGCASGDYPEKLKVKYGTLPSSLSMSNLLFDDPNVVNDLTPINQAIDFTPSTSGVFYIGFNAYSDADQFALLIDNITVNISPTCLPPSALTTSSITSSSATLSWIESSSTPSNGYQFEVRTSGAPGSGATGLSVSGITSAGDVNAEVTGLTDNTAYSVYVRSDCGSGDYSSWSVAHNFSTTGVAAPVANTASSIGATGFTASWESVTSASGGYLLDVSTSSTFGSGTLATLDEGFESGLSGSYVNGTLNLGSGPWTSVDAGLRVTGTGQFNSGATASQMKANTGTLTSPALDNVGTVSFYARASSGTSTITIRKIINSITSTVATISITSTYAQYSVDVNEYSTGVQIVFAIGSTFGYIDDIAITYGYSPSYVTGYQAKPVPGQSSETSMVTGLSPISTYYYRVRAVGANSTSTNSNVITVTTGANKVSSETGDWNSITWIPAGVPVSKDDVTINHAVTLAGQASCHNLTIGTGSLKVNSGGSLLPTGTATGSVTFERAFGPSESWHLVSSPVTNQAISGDWTPTGSYAGGWGYDFYAWDEPSATWLNQKVGANNITSFVPGKGYLVAFQAINPTKTFTGTLNSGNITLPVTVSGSTTFGHANLAGNPYSSSIDWKNNSGFTRSMLKDDDIGEGVGYSLYTWNQSANNYGAYISNSASDLGTNSVNRYVAPMQGFFVVAASDGDFVINNNARVHSTQTWLKSGNDNSFRLKATAPAAYGSDELLLEFGHESSNGGAEKWSSFVAEAPGIYTPKNGKNYSIRFLNSVSEHPVIPVSFTAGVEGNYTITADFNTAVFSQVTLHDSKTNTSHNLSTNPVYSFTAAPGDDASRFSLHFASVGLGETPTTQSVLAYYHDGALYVNNTEAGAEIMLFGISGQLLKQQTATAGLNTLQAGKLSAGVYVVRVQSAAGTYSSKVIVTR
jgi:hypothetical protein